MPASPPPGLDEPVQKLDKTIGREPTVEDQIRAYEWQDENCLVVPYDPAKFPEGYLKSVYTQMVLEGTLDWFFPGQEMPWEQFETTVAGRQVLLGLVKPDLELAGAAILWQIEGRLGMRKADFGFAFFRRYWATRLIRDMARLTLRLVYSAEVGIDRLIGFTLAGNLPARHFATEMGFQELAVLPRWVPSPLGFRDAVVFAQDREIFEHVGSAERTILREEHGG